MSMRRSIHMQQIQTVMSYHYLQVSCRHASIVLIIDRPSFLLVDPINGQVQSQVLVDPTGIMTNSNHSTGPLPPSSSRTTSAGGDHKMVPAAIGSERKRQMPLNMMAALVTHQTSSDWSSIPKRKPRSLVFVLITRSFASSSSSLASYPPYPPQPQTRDYLQ